MGPNTGNSTRHAPIACHYLNACMYLLIILMVSAFLHAQAARAQNVLPSMKVISPKDGAAFRAGQGITFQAKAVDFEDGNISAEAAWTSDIDGELGRGAAFTRTLSPGIHSVTVRVRDSEGGEATHTLTVTVGDLAEPQPPPEAPGPAPPEHPEAAAPKDDDPVPYVPTPEELAAQPEPPPPPAGAVPDVPGPPLPEPVRLEGPRQKGMAYPIWWHDQYACRQSDRSLSELKMTGTTHIALIVTWYQMSTSSTDVMPHQQKTPSNRSLIHAVRRIRELGMHPVLKLHLDIANDGGWRGDITFTKEEDWKAWFSSYSDFVEQYAIFAAEHEVGLLCIGTELKGTVLRKNDWETLIKGIDWYPGKLTYAANYDSYHNVPWWDKLDYIGVNAYFPLTEKAAPAPEELAAAWSRYRDELSTFSRTRQRPVLFTEVGYRSVDGTNTHPWDYSRGEPDNQEQADCYRALLQTMWDQPWFAGMYCWCWYYSQDFEDYGLAGKPARDVLQEWYIDPENPPQAVAAAPEEPAPDSAPQGEESFVTLPSSKKQYRTLWIGDSVSRPIGVEPRHLIPAATGNTWTYSWTSPAAEKAKENKAEAPRVYSIRRYTYNEKSMFATCSDTAPEPHQETYTIVRVDGDHHFFRVSSDPDASGRERDGRYRDSVENCWTWWNDGRSGGLTESVKRRWRPNVREYLLGTENTTDYPADHRNAIHVEVNGTLWTSKGFTYYMDPHGFDYNIGGATLTVPAGTFEGCVETVERVRKRGKMKSPVLWETHTFWAPSVGMVRDYQRLPDGTITYDMQLTSYTINGVTKPEPKAAQAEARQKHGFNYSPYRDNEDPDSGIGPLPDEIRSDFTLIPLVTGCVRTYGSAGALGLIPGECERAGVDCYLGAWISRYPEENRREVEALLRIARMGLKRLKALVVGNEAILRKDRTEKQMVTLVREAKEATGLPVTVAETWETWLECRELAEEVDFLMVHIHPYWDKVPVEDAARHVIDKWKEVQAAFPGKRIVIGETGWPSGGEPKGKAIPSEENQSRFLSEFTQLAAQEQAEYFLFALFDEDWKSKFEGGAGPHWGIYTSQGTLKEHNRGLVPPRAAKGIRRPPREVTRQEVQAPLLVYSEGSGRGAFQPSGWMGDTKHITLDRSCTTDPHAGKTCVRFSYSPMGLFSLGWAGVYWQHPLNNWGQYPGYSLTGARRLTFWARGHAGDEIAEFKAGGISDQRFEHRDSFGPVTTGIIKLTKDWKQYTIDLAGQDTSTLIGGFCCVVKRSHNLGGCTIYLDDITFE